jgi:hypothetical protein
MLSLSLSLISITFVHIHALFTLTEREHTTPTSFQDVAEWLTDAAVRKKLNVISCHLVSSRIGEGRYLWACGKLWEQK